MPFTACALVIFLLGSTASHAIDQAVFYGVLSENDAAEVRQWNERYWLRADTGELQNPSSTGFSNDSMQSPLFNPVRAVRYTLESFKLMNSADCDGLTILNPGVGDIAVETMLREAMLHGEFTTDTAANAAGTSAHFERIAISERAEWEMAGVNLISRGIRLASLTGGTQPGTYIPLSDLSMTTVKGIQVLTQTGPALAASSEGVPIAKALLTGEESQAERFERGVATLAQNEPNLLATELWRIDAAFGVNGSLPLLGVTFDDAFVLIDTVNGTLVGPFAIGSTIDATTLLAAHDAFQSGGDVQYFSSAGCITYAGWFPFFPAEPANDTCSAHSGSTNHRSSASVPWSGRSLPLDAESQSSWMDKRSIVYLQWYDLQVRDLQY